MAPLTEAALYVFELPEQINVIPLIVAGVAGMEPLIIAIIV